MRELNEHFLALEFDKVLINLSKYALSSKAKEKCLNLNVYNQKAQIEYELKLVDEAKKIIDDTQNSFSTGEILNIESVLKNFEYKSLN